MDGRVIVVGSVNVDLVVTTEWLPGPGETVIGGRFARHDGGKGGNQAIAEHVLLPFAGSIEDADAELAPRVTEELLRDVTEAVPEEWLGDGSRELYVEYLRRRVEAPRAFVAEAERARAA